MQAPQSQSMSLAHAMRKQPCASTASAGPVSAEQRVLSGQTQPSSHAIGSQAPSDPHRSPSAHESVVHAGRQKAPSTGSHEHGTFSRTQTSPSPQSAAPSHSSGTGAQMPHARGTPGGTQDSELAQSPVLRQGANSGGGGA